MNEGDHEVSTAKTMVDAIAQTPPSRVSLTSLSTGKRSAAELSLRRRKKARLRWHDNSRS